MAKGTEMGTAMTSGVSTEYLSAVQRRRKWALLALMIAGLILFGFATSRWQQSAPNFYDAIEWTGMIMILVCVVGRTWCSLYIGGRKKEELVVNGPYSVVRNPLYVFTLIGAVGVGWQMGSLVMGAICALATFMVFRVVIDREEAFLRSAFPDAFAKYAARVPKLWPNPASWMDTDMIVVSPKPVMRTFADSCLFLLAIPIAEGIDALHTMGSLPVVLRLP
jgi:protein-S-isoprenylcysteine O-methyltransferase Ste14